MDRETVITHLQIIHTWAEFARERDLHFFTAKHLEDIAQWADDAIELLKEQDETIKELQSAYDYLQKQFFESQGKLLTQDSVEHACEILRANGWKETEPLCSECEAVHVVRCEDCKWRNTNVCFCKSKDDVQDDWFCSEGKRNEGR